MRFHGTMLLAAAVCALSLGAGGALAKGPVGPQAGAVKAAAAYMGISLEELRTELKAGNSLANSALKHGKTVAGLEAAIVADAQKHLDAAVAAGKLTAEQAAQKLAKLKASVSELVMKTGKPGAKGGKKKGKARQAAKAAAKTAATYVGISLEQLRTELQSGKSLAEVATAHGKSVEGLKAAIVADGKKVIDRLVSEGKISAERGQRYLEQIQANVDKLVNAKPKGKK